LRALGFAAALIAASLGAGIAFAQDANEAGNWTMPARDYQNTRFSPLDQINASNVRTLTLAWTFSTGVLRGHEAAPIVADNTLYIVTPYPNLVYALDLAQPGAPVKWKFSPNPVSSSQGVACCDLVNRGAIWSNGRLFFNTLDNQTFALDARTGTEVWHTRLGDIKQGETMTMAPLVVKDRVLVGNSGGEFGVRGWLTALDAATGKIAWRAFSTGPDNEVLIGDQFHRSIRPIAARISARVRGPGRRGRSGEAPYGDSSRTTPRSISSTTAPRIRGRGIRASGRATTNGRRASSPAIRCRDRRAGSTN